MRQTLRASPIGDDGMAEIWGFHSHNIISCKNAKHKWMQPKGQLLSAEKVGSIISAAMSGCTILLHILSKSNALTWRASAPYVRS